MSSEDCEVCGKELRRLQVHSCPERRGEPFGVPLELREHTFGIAHHTWWQEHNCIRPEPDRCYTGCEVPFWIAKPTPACCLAYRRALDALDHVDRP